MQFQVNYISLRGPTKFSTGHNIIIIISGMLLGIIVRRRSKREGHTTSQSHSKAQKVVKSDFTTLFGISHVFSLQKYC